MKAVNQKKMESSEPEKKTEMSPVQISTESLSKTEKFVYQRWVEQTTMWSPGSE